MYKTVQTSIIYIYIYIKIGDAGRELIYNIVYINIKYIDMYVNVFHILPIYEYICSYI